MWNDPCFDGIDDADEIPYRHVFNGRVSGAVAAAMKTGKVAAKRAFPEKVAHVVHAGVYAFFNGKQIERDALT